MDFMQRILEILGSVSKKQCSPQEHEVKKKLKHFCIKSFITRKLKRH